MKAYYETCHTFCLIIYDCWKRILVELKLLNLFFGSRFLVSKCFWNKFMGAGPFPDENAIFLTCCHIITPCSNLLFLKVFSTLFAFRSHFLGDNTLTIKSESKSWFKSDFFAVYNLIYAAGAILSPGIETQRLLPGFWKEPLVTDQDFSSQVYTSMESLMPYILQQLLKSFLVHST